VTASHMEHDGAYTRFCVIVLWNSRASGIVASLKKLERTGILTKPCAGHGLRPTSSSEGGEGGPGGAGVRIYDDKIRDGTRRCHAGEVTRSSGNEKKRKKSRQKEEKWWGEMSISL
jgi:hypothetical protein